LYLNKQFRAKIRNKDTVRSTHKMLAYVLALVVGLGSFAIYMAAFFFPEVHRKQDFIWSGVGLFYALVLWVCAGRITGGVLLGQMASVALLGWFGWQTLTLRRELIPSEQQTAIPNQDELKGKVENVLPMNTFRGLLERITGLFRKGKAEAQTAQAKLEAIPKPQVEKKAESEPAAVAAPPAEATIPSTATTPPVEAKPTEEAAITPTADATPEVTEAPDTQDTPAATIEAPATPAADDTTPSESPELNRPNPPDPELVEAAQKSDPPDLAKMHEEVESVAGMDLAPPAEPPGSGDPEDRQAALETPATIEAVPIDPENPPTAT
jgi:hypothetical protein